MKLVSVARNKVQSTLELYLFLMKLENDISFLTT